MSVLTSPWYTVRSGMPGCSEVQWAQMWLWTNKRSNKCTSGIRIECDCCASLVLLSLLFCQNAGIEVQVKTLVRLSLWIMAPSFVSISFCFIWFDDGTYRWMVTCFSSAFHDETKVTGQSLPRIKLFFMSYFIHYNIIFFFGTCHRWCQLDMGKIARNEVRNLFYKAY